jgi:hypothetical protein
MCLINQHAMKTYRGVVEKLPPGKEPSVPITGWALEPVDVVAKTPHQKPNTGRPAVP